MRTLLKNNNLTHPSIRCKAKSLFTRTMVWAACAVLAMSAVVRAQDPFVVTFYGLAKDQNGAPLPDVRIVLTNDGTPVDTTYTDSTGLGMLVDVMDPSPVIQSDDPSLPRGFYVNQNYPNGFDNTTTIPFGTVKSGKIDYEVFNINGQSIFRGEDFVPPGHHLIRLAGLDGLPRGMYLIRINTPSGSKTAKMIKITPAQPDIGSIVHEIELNKGNPNRHKMGKITANRVMTFDREGYYSIEANV